MSRRPLFSVRHRTSRRPFDVLYKKVQFQLELHFHHGYWRKIWLLSNQPGQTQQDWSTLKLIESSFLGYPTSLLFAHVGLWTTALWHDQKWPYIAQRAVVGSVSSILCYGIAWYCMVLHGIAWYCMELQVVSWYCMILHSIA